MKKIMFNDKFLLTQAVLDGRKTQTRRIIKVQPPYKNFDIAFPVFVEEDWHTNPLYGAFCWINKDNPDEHTDWIRPAFKVGEVVAVAQSYKDIFSAFSQHPNPQLNIGVKNPTDTAGWNNKMFVKGELMPRQIRITDVRVERLQDISDECCLKEGVMKWDAGQKDIPFFCYPNSAKCDYDTPQEAFAHLINKVSRKDVWKENPYVFVYDFELIK